MGEENQQWGSPSPFPANQELHQSKVKHELEKIPSAHDDENDSNKKKKKKEKKEKEPTVSPYKLFRYATPLDLLGVFVASIGSIGVGVLQPLSVITIISCCINSLGYDDFIS